MNMHSSWSKHVLIIILKFFDTLIHAALHYDSNEALITALE